jgi:formylmethanofuran--tetrahydromethanopterin N-formyltransferase
MELNGVFTEDTYCEAFDGLVVRLLVTARNEALLKKAVYSATALPCTVFGEAEGGVEAWVSDSQTPDGRRGAIIQLWVNYGKTANKRLEEEIGKRVRQGILVVPTTRVFNALAVEGEPDDEGVCSHSESGTPQTGWIDSMARIGHCGDGYEKVVNKFNREMISIPLMMGDFLIEKQLGYSKGVMGGNVWFFCENEDVALEAGDRAVEAVSKIEGAITAFDVCSAGSKVETNFPEIGPTTNHPFCPSLACDMTESKVPQGVMSIPEIVINGLNEDVVKTAMRAALYAASEVDGVIKMSAGNFGGKLGKHKIYLQDII